MSLPRQSLFSPNRGKLYSYSFFHHGFYLACSRTSYKWNDIQNVLVCISLFSLNILFLILILITVCIGSLFIFTRLLSLVSSFTYLLENAELVKTKILCVYTERNKSGKIIPKCVQPLPPRYATGAKGGNGGILFVDVYTFILIKFLLYRDLKIYSFYVF